MLQRSSQVGEFYRMSPPAVYDAGVALPDSYMDIMIYDEESDRHIHIPFDQALFATTYGAGGGVVGDLFKWSEETNPAGPTDTDWGKYTSSIEARVNKRVNGAVVPYKANPTSMASYTPAGGGGPTDFATTTPTAADMINLGKRAWDSVNEPNGAGNGIVPEEAALECAAAALFACRNGIWCPVEIVVCRPFIEHLMLSAIVTVAGRDTGATLFGPADMQARSAAQLTATSHTHHRPFSHRPSACADLGQHLRQDDRGPLHVRA